jgi:hypothetical protein
MVPTTLPINLYIDGIAEWRWAMTGNEIRPVILSVFGDWFYLKRDGAVYVVDTLEGNESMVSDSYDKFIENMKNVEFRDHWFLESFINRLNIENIEFSIGQCVGWKLAPIAGGKTEYDNLGVFEYKIYNNVMAKIVKQIRGVV